MDRISPTSNPSSDTVVIAANPAARPVTAGQAADSFTMPAAELQVLEANAPKIVFDQQDMPAAVVLDGALWPLPPYFAKSPSPKQLDNNPTLARFKTVLGNPLLFQLWCLGLHGRDIGGEWKIGESYVLKAYDPSKAGQTRALSPLRLVPADEANIKNRYFGLTITRLESGFVLSRVDGDKAFDLGVEWYEGEIGRPCPAAEKLFLKSLWQGDFMSRTGLKEGYAFFKNLPCDPVSFFNQIATGLSPDRRLPQERVTLRLSFYRYEGNQYLASIHFFTEGKEPQPFNRENMADLVWAPSSERFLLESSHGYCAAVFSKALARFATGGMKQTIAGYENDEKITSAKAWEVTGQPVLPEAISTGFKTSYARAQELFELVTNATAPAKPALPDVSTLMPPPISKKGTGLRLRGNPNFETFKMIAGNPAHFGVYVQALYDRDAHSPWAVNTSRVLVGENRRTAAEAGKPLVGLRMVTVEKAKNYDPHKYFIVTIFKDKAGYFIPKLDGAFSFELGLGWLEARLGRKLNQAEKNFMATFWGVLVLDGSVQLLASEWLKYLGASTEDPVTRLGALAKAADPRITIPNQAILSVASYASHGRRQSGAIKILDPLKAPSSVDGEAHLLFATAADNHRLLVDYSGSHAFDQALALPQAMQSTAVQDKVRKDRSDKRHHSGQTSAALAPSREKKSTSEAGVDTKVIRRKTDSGQDPKTPSKKIATAEKKAARLERNQKLKEKAEKDKQAAWHRQKEAQRLDEERALADALQRQIEQKATLQLREQIEAVVARKKAEAALAAATAAASAATEATKKAAKKPAAHAIVHIAIAIGDPLTVMDPPAIKHRWMEPIPHRPPDANTPDTWDKLFLLLNIIVALSQRSSIKNMKPAAPLVSRLEILKSLLDRVRTTPEDKRQEAASCLYAWINRISSHRTFLGLSDQRTITTALQCLEGLGVHKPAAGIEVTALMAQWREAMSENFLTAASMPSRLDAALAIADRLLQDGGLPSILTISYEAGELLVDSELKRFRPLKGFDGALLSENYKKDWLFHVVCLNDGKVYDPLLACPLDLPDYLDMYFGVVTRNQVLAGPVSLMSKPRAEIKAGILDSKAFKAELKYIAEQAVINAQKAEKKAEAAAIAAADKEARAAEKARKKAEAAARAEEIRSARQTARRDGGAKPVTAPVPVCNPSSPVALKMATSKGRAPAVLLGGRHFVGYLPRSNALLGMKPMSFR